MPQTPAPAARSYVWLRGYKRLIMLIRKILQVIGNILLAILQGKLLLRLRIDDYFPHIMYTIFLMGVAIWIGMEAEKAMVKVEKNKESLNGLRIERVQAQVKMTSLYNVVHVEEMLASRGSKLKYPTEAAKRVEQ